MIKILHAADLHLDSPLKGLERYEGAPVEKIRTATRRAFDNLIRFAIDEQIDLLLIAGDLYDGDWPDYNTGLYFVDRMQALAKAGVKVCMVSGNHDAQSQITRSLRLPENVTQFSTANAETKRYDDLAIAVHGQGFATRAVMDDLSRHYPESTRGYFNIGLLHTSLDGKPGHAPYAPCSVEGLLSKGYDYWALGHIHKREIIRRNPSWIVFSGNLQGRHINENGDKGCYYFELVDGAIKEHRFVALDVFRWHTLELTLSGEVHLDGVIDRLQTEIKSFLDATDAIAYALRITLTGDTELHDDLHRNIELLESELRAICNSISERELWLQKVALATRPATDAKPETQSAALADLETYIDTLKQQESLDAIFPSQVKALLKKLPAEIRRDGFLNLESKEEASILLDEAGEFLKNVLQKPAQEDAHET